MSEEEKKAIEYFKDDINYLEKDLKNPNFLGKFITIRDKEFLMLKIILSLIQKQEKVIDEMGIVLMGIKGTIFNNMTLEETEQHFYRKVKEDE